MKYYPLFMDLAGRECLVVGAGAVAARKARSLLGCGAIVTVVGERPVAAFRGLGRRGVRLLQRRFRAGDLGRQALVIAATDDRSVNAAVAAAARKRGIPVNAVDDPPNCTFIVPAVVQRGGLTVAISTGGRSPAAARLVKQRISEVLGEEYVALVRLLGAHRGRMKDTVAGQATRAGAWKRMIEDGVLESLRKGDRAGAAKTVRRCIEESVDPACAPARERPRERIGRRGGAKRGSPAARTKGRTVGVCRHCRHKLRDRTPQPARERSSSPTKRTTDSRR